jgi:hypothetical protein
MPADRTPYPTPPGAPSRYLRQHVTLDEPQIDNTMFMAAWRVRTRVDRLLRDGLITPYAWRIAGEFKTLYERAYQEPLRAHDPARLRVDGGQHGRGYPRARQLAAAARLRQLRIQLDDGDVRLLEAVIVDDLRWCQVGQCFHVHAKTARRRGIEALRMLTTVW